ncbi:MAG: polysaccharide pyruvyl transferase CsaB [Lachnospirales bacterium]
MYKYKVLMVTMKLDIGGAETHILELSKALIKKGIEVHVASNGGQYVKEMEDAGVIHYNVPLHNKVPFNMIKSYFLLKKIIQENNIRLIHSHARIPSFLIGLLKKNMNFRFVTTAHLNFRTTFPFNILSNWGEASLVVSEDIEDYLINSYKVKKGNILLTINGIDVNKFSKHEVKHLEDEFNLGEGKKIVYMSRMDTDRSYPAHVIIGLAEKINNKYPKSEIIIIGDGNDFEKIKDKASRANKKIGRKIITLTGGRIDTADLVNLSHVFVGVSRSALEAMACEKPVILAGNQGYLGILNRENLDTAINTNFCCRDCKNVEEDILFNDIEKILDMEEAEYKDLGVFSRQVIIDKYSVTRMADDALKLYEKVAYSQKEIDVMISGYYGFRNNGDDILLKSIVDNLKKEKPNIKIVVLSKIPKETSEIYSVQSINRFNIFKITRALKRTNLLISGGGTLIQDHTSTNSLIYYLFLIYQGHKKGAKTMLYSNGIGPVNKKINRELSTAILNKMDAITLRDQEAFNEIKKMNVINNNISVTVDPAFALTMKVEKNVDFKNYFVVSIRNWKYLESNFEEEICKFCNHMGEKYGLTPVFVSMQPINDTEISQRIINRLTIKAYLYKESFTIEEILSILKHSNFVLGMRLHTIIYSIKVNTPVIGLVYDPKVEGIMSSIGENTYVNIKEINADILINHYVYILNNMETIKKNLALFNTKAKEKALESPKEALRLINLREF